MAHQSVLGAPCFFFFSPDGRFLVVQGSRPHGNWQYGLFSGEKVELGHNPVDEQNSGQVIFGNLADGRNIRTDRLGLGRGLPSPYLQEPGLLTPAM